MHFIKFFTDVTPHDFMLIGGKNAALAQMIQQLSSCNIRVPLGFAITTQAYWHHLRANNLVLYIERELAQLKNNTDIQVLTQVSSAIKNYITQAPLPDDLIHEIAQAYTQLSKLYNTDELDVAVRSSATAEDLPHASFAGQQETFLHINSLSQVLNATKKCMASLFTKRALVYRQEQGFEHFDVALSVGIQKMVRADLSIAGTLFTLDTESGFKDIVVIDASYGLGEPIVQGSIIPDAYHVFKPTLKLGYESIITKKLGTKEQKLIYKATNTAPELEAEFAQISTELVPVSAQEQKQFCMTDADILDLACMALTIEDYYTQQRQHWSPMDIEWAKDGLEDTLYIVQARPETVHTKDKKAQVLHKYYITAPDKPEVLVSGQSIGQKISTGKARVITDIQSIDTHEFKQGDILVTRMTDPDWVPLMKKASGIITDQGGRTCHAAIVSRELGIPALVGTRNATEVIVDKQPITLDCSQGSVGYVYNNELAFTRETIVLTQLPKSPVPLLINIADPDQAYELSFLPVDGVGLARIEFIISNFIKVHPLALYFYDMLQDTTIKERIQKLTSAYATPHEYYIKTLAYGIGTIAAAFYPRPVTVRLSDFKSNEYRNLLGGQLFEPKEENPMIGFRGAVRYTSDWFAPAFELECAALRLVRETMGLHNTHIMVPFVRTVHEAQTVVKLLAEQNLVHNKQGLLLTMMCELPANILVLEEFARVFTSFSLGSNDLTQLVLGVDRDSALLAQFNECDNAVKKFLVLALEKARTLGVYMSICGQAPSDFPEIAELLIAHNISALSLNPDSVIPFLARLTAASSSSCTTP